MTADQLVGLASPLAAGRVEESGAHGVRALPRNDVEKWAERNSEGGYGHQFSSSARHVRSYFDIVTASAMLSAAAWGRHRRCRRRRRCIAMWNAQRTLIVRRERPLKTGRFQKSSTHRRNHQCSDDRMCVCQRFFNAVCVRAIGDVKFLCDSLTA
jgi:hypothetical protein